MSDPSLVEHWAIVEGWLRQAKSQLSVPSVGAETALSEFEHFISHNELELALDALTEAAALSNQTHRFWDSMCQAAAHMKLEEKHLQFAERWSALRRPPHVDD